MIDKATLEALSQGPAIDAADRATHGSLPDVRGVLALPDNFKTHDLEKLLPQRRRVRGVMKSTVLAHFAAYVSDHAEAGATVFVDPNPDSMRAVAVLNLGGPASPGHADNTAVYCPEATACYQAMCDKLRGNLGQQALAEWLEDWSEFVQCRNGDEVIETKRAVAAVRKVTIESLSRIESTQQKLSASRSAFEQVQAASGGQPLPSEVWVQCRPTDELQPRLFVLRVSVLTSDKAPQFVLRLARREWHRQEIATELAAVVREKVDGAPVYVGVYNAGA